MVLVLLMSARCLKWPQGQSLAIPDGRRIRASSKALARKRHVQVAQIVSSVSGSGTYHVRSDCFAKHKPVSFGRSKRHLAAMPWFIGRWLANLGSGCHRSCVVGIDRIDREVRDVTMVAQVGSR